jgi:hypothetical protein
MLHDRCKLDSKVRADCDKSRRIKVLRVRRRGVVNPLTGCGTSARGALTSSPATPAEAPRRAGDGTSSTTAGGTPRDARGT